MRTFSYLRVTILNPFIMIFPKVQNLKKISSVPQLDPWIAPRVFVMRRVENSPSAWSFNASDRFTTSSSVAAVLRPVFGEDLVCVEMMFAVALDRQNRIIGLLELGRGHRSGVLVDLSILGLFMCSVGAAALILAHNHPSGTLKASSSDIELTKEVKSVCALFKVSLLDHVILTEENYYSFADDGIL